jgi:NTE family protein
MLGAPIDDVDIMLGTSAGSVLAAALRCGATIEEIIAFQRGEAAGPFAEVGQLYGGAWPRPPRLRLGSPQLAASALRAPHRVHPTVGVSALLPLGRENHDGLHAMVRVLHGRATPADAAIPHWVERGHTWVVAVDYDTGERVVFGRPGAPRLSLADAVVASCSVPCWFEPHTVGGRRYVDGGVRSATSLGLLADQGVDRVFVLAPMASVVADNPWLPHKRLERQVRAMLTLALLRHVRTLQALGVQVTVLTPGPEDLAVMGVNLMDPRRRVAVLETSLRTSPQALAAADQAATAA